MSAHRNDVMDGEGPIQCSDCECHGVFSNEACYISHKRKKHKTKEEDEEVLQISGHHKFQEWGGRGGFPSQHKFGNVYFEKREDVYSGSESSSTFWSTSTFVTLGNLKDGGGGGAL